MVVLLYGRRIEVDVAGLNVQELRISIELGRQIDSTQDKGTVAIYNLRPEHEQQIEDRGDAIRIRAGYPGTTAILFDGQVQRVVRAREHLSRITRIDLGDQVRRRDVLGGVFFGSYSGPVSVRELVREIAATMGPGGGGLPVGPLDAIAAGATYTDFYGGGDPSVFVLSSLLRTVDCYWFEADGVIRINKVGSTQPDAPDITISPENGMIGSPIATDEGAEVRTFLNARIVLGCLVRLESATITGSWKVVGLRHEADNWSSGPFETFCDLREI